MNNSLKLMIYLKTCIDMYVCWKNYVWNKKRKASFLNSMHCSEIVRNCQKYDDIKREYLQFLLPFLRTWKRIRNIPFDASFVRKHDIHYNNQCLERKQVRVLKKKIWYIAVFETTKQKTNRQNFLFTCILKKINTVSIYFKKVCIYVML